MVDVELVDVEEEEVDPPLVYVAVLKFGGSLPLCQMTLNVTEFRQPIQVQSHLEMPGILVQLGRIQRT